MRRLSGIRRGRSCEHHQVLTHLATSTALNDVCCTQCARVEPAKSRWARNVPLAWKLQMVQLRPRTLVRYGWHVAFTTMDGLKLRQRVPLRRQCTRSHTAASQFGCMLKLELL